MVSQHSEQWSRNPLPRQWRTMDVEQHTCWSGGGDLSFKQLSGGRFQGTVTEWLLPGVQVVRDWNNQSLFKSGDMGRGRIMFGVPIGGPPNLKCLGHEFGAHGLLVAPTDDLPELYTAAGLDVVSINVDRALLIDLGQSSDAVWDNGPCFHSLPDLPARRDLIKLISMATANHGKTGLNGLHHDATRKQARDLILSCLLEMYEKEAVTVLTVTARKRIVDRACEYALAHCDEPLSILDLCRGVGASRRKLQYCFQDVVGLSPVTYLRVLRLNAVHKALLESDASERIQDLAARWGFMHLSRFATDYRALFGELPSDTMRRCAGYSAKSG